MKETRVGYATIDVLATQLQSRIKADWTNGIINYEDIIACNRMDLYLRGYKI